jgi:hypothetical protein
MPEFFVDNGGQQEVKLGYSYAPRNDNKHVMVQTSVTAMRQQNVTIALELLHGLYWKEFQDVTPDLFDAVFFAPSRAGRAGPWNYWNDFMNPSPWRSTKKGRLAHWKKQRELEKQTTFLAFLHQEIAEEVNLPMNMPVVQNEDGDKVLEQDVFIDRIADIMGGDPDYQRRQSCRRVELCDPTGTKFEYPQGSQEANLGGGASCGDCDEYPDQRYRPFNNTHYLWWGSIQPRKKDTPSNNECC